MLPSGTITFLFTDIEGSTRLWETNPAEMGLAFPLQEKILRETIKKHAGYPYKMIGDAFQAAFSSAQDALASAVEVQREIASQIWGETPIRIRMALHTGVTEERGDDYVGPVLNRAARLLAAGHGGQILLTQATAELVLDLLPNDLRLKDLGVHRLRDLVRPDHIFQVIGPGLQDNFPPLKTVDILPNNLPFQLTSFIGREKEKAALRSLLVSKGTRLVTLTGSGGIGKTRLSLQIAADLLDQYPDGAWFVELASVSNPDHVPKIVANVLDVVEVISKPLITSLVDFLQTKKMLLILDNCEHLVDASASLADTLLRTCPNLTILVSSREILGIGGEVPFRVPSLAQPDIHHLPSYMDLAGFEAVRLFVERAQTASSDFVLTEENGPLVAQVVNCLDGIPLAIELAAARVRLLSLAQIATRLDNVFRLLIGGSRAALPRHQTLRAMIDWSYDLLSTKERILLRRLSIFSGGWTLEAAEGICADGDWGPNDQSIQPEAILELLSQLADKSLIIQYEASSPDMRYRMMEPIRQYAHEKIAEQKESERMRSGHLSYFMNFAETSEPFLRTNTQVAWLNRLADDLDNLRLALDWGLENDLEAALRLAAALFWFWHIRGLGTEGIRWLELGLTAEEDFPGSPLVRAKALLAQGALISQHEKPQRAKPILEESLAIYLTLDPEHRSGLANAYRWQATLAQRTRNHAKAEAMAQKAIDIFSDLNDRFGISECLPLLIKQGSASKEIKRIYLQVLALKREIGDIDGIAFTLQILSGLAFEEGDHQNASIWLDESLERFREVGNYRFASNDLHNKASMCWTLGDYTQADHWIEQALAVSRDNGDVRQTILNLLGKGNIALSKGDFQEAGQSFGSALQLAEEIADPRLRGSALVYLGEVNWFSGSPLQAKERWEAAQSIGEELHYPPILFFGALWQGKSALWEGNFLLACSLFNQCLLMMIEMKEWINIAIALEALASLAVQHKKLSLAAQLFGAANRRFHLFPNMLTPQEREQRERDLTLLRTALGETKFAVFYQEGQNLTNEQITIFSGSCV